MCEFALVIGVFRISGMVCKDVPKGTQISRKRIFIIGRVPAPQRIMIYAIIDIHSQRPTQPYVCIFVMEQQIVCKTPILKPAMGKKAANLNIVLCIRYIHITWSGDLYFCHWSGIARPDDGTGEKVGLEAIAKVECLAGIRFRKQCQVDGGSMVFWHEPSLPVVVQSKGCMASVAKGGGETHLQRGVFHLGCQ